MAVAFDATGTATATTTTPLTFTHTPVGTPRGILLFIMSSEGSDPVNGAVTYGGVAMAAVTGAAAVDTAGEPSWCSTWFLGSAIPTGAQTVSIAHTGSAATKRAVSISVTAAADTVISGTPVLLQEDGTLAEQNVDTSTTAALRFAGIASGLPSTDPPVAGANSTGLASGNLASVNRRWAAVQETTGGSGSRAVGWTNATSDDRAAVHVAIAESGGGGGGPNLKRSFVPMIG